MIESASWCHQSSHCSKSVETLVIAQEKNAVRAILYIVFIKIVRTPGCDHFIPNKILKYCCLGWHAFASVLFLT